MIAQAASPMNFEARIAEQQARIDQGIASGTLTRNEADDLQDNLNWIKHRLARYGADGRLGPNEQRTLWGLLDQNEAMIFKKKHNVVSRFYDNDFRTRIQDQQKRIDQGVYNKTLTRAEADILQANLNTIRDQFNRMRWDGTLSMRERDRMDDMLDRNSRMIYEKKHNPAVRFSW